MPRKGPAPRRPLVADPVYNSPLVTQLINKILLRGKRALAERIVYNALEGCREKTGTDPVVTLKRAMDNVKPTLEVRSRRVGGATYQVPVEREWGRGALFLGEVAGSRAGDQHYVYWFAKLERLAASPGAAVALARQLLQLDVRSVLPAIRVPTLVLHKRDDRAVPIAEGRYIADHVPGAKFVELPGSDHWPWIGHDEALDEIQEFLTGMRESEVPERAVATVMFLDLVGSTERAAELGDRQWAELLERFYAAVRHELDRYAGREISTAGDGFFVTFDGPARAIRCAVALVTAIGGLGLKVRVGIHTGEVERVGDNVGGIGVVIGARVGALAGPGEILVSRTVTDLVVGSEMAFHQRGRHELKGVPGEWELYAVGAD